MMQPHMLHAWCMCMCMDMLTCCRLQPQRPHLRVESHGTLSPKPGALHRRTDGRLLRGAARAGAGRGGERRGGHARGRHVARRRPGPFTSPGGRCDVRQTFWPFFTSISVRCVIYMRPSRQASPKPNHYVVQYCKAVLTSSSSVPPSPRPPAPTPRGPGRAPGPAVRDGPRVRNRLEFWAKTCKLKTRKLSWPIDAMY